MGSAKIPALVLALVAATLACNEPERPAASPSSEPSAAPPARPTSTASDGEGAGLLGARMPPWRVAAWANTEPLELSELRGKVVVVRFWTDTCPYCRASMPALQQLAVSFADDPVVFVGLFHEKPRGRADAWADATRAAESWGVSFPIGHDADWATLRAWWLDTGERAATSSTIVLGKTGEVIHVHPGPVYFPSDDPEEAQQDRDYLALRDAIARGIADDA